MPETKISPHKVRHLFAALHFIMYVSKLWSNQAIQGPWNRICPSIPPPPHRNSLSIDKSTLVNWQFDLTKHWWQGKLWTRTYRSGNKKARKQVPYWIKCRWDYSANVLIGGQANSHHPIICEIEQCEVHEKQVPKVLCSCPFKGNHGIYYDTIY